MVYAINSFTAAKRGKYKTPIDRDTTPNITERSNIIQPKIAVGRSVLRGSKNKPGMKMN